MTDVRKTSILTSSTQLKSLDLIYVPSSKQPSSVFLEQKYGFSDSLVLFTDHESSDSLLHHNATRLELLVTDFFQISHLTGSEKDFGLAKLVHVRILDVLGQNVLAGFLHVVSIDVAQFA